MTTKLNRPGSKMRFAVALATVVGALAVCLLMLGACQNGAASVPAPEPTAAATATFQVFAPVATQPITVTAKYSSSVMPTRTVQQVLDITANSPALLAGKHLAAGLKCDNCHNPYPPQGAPSRETCLNCHQQDYAEIAAIPSQRNPHNNHMAATIPCVDCHHAHVPYESACLQCHLEPCDCSLR